MPAKTFQDYADDLDALVHAAREAAASGVAARRKKAFTGLSDFVADSNNLLDGVDELDAVARETMNDLTLAELDQSFVGELAKRTADVAALIKKFSNQAATNSSSAAALRLERVKAVADDAASAISEIKKLVDVVDDQNADGKKVTEAAASAIDALEKLWKILPKVG